MDEVLNLRVEVNGASFDAARQSIESLCAAVDAAQGVDGGLPDGLVLPDDASDLIRGEVVDSPTSGAVKLNCIEIQPSDQHLELVAAIAAHGNSYSVRVTHGWPVLSVVARTSTVADREAVASRLPEGPIPPEQVEIAA